jgi:hypothetical protein
MKSKLKLQERVITELVGSLTIEGDTWEHFIKRERPPYEMTGKYLFFSADRDQLEKIVIGELEHGGFHVGKIPLAGKNTGSDYVLCLYYKDNSRKHELATKYRNHQGIDYKYWKSDAATDRGEYAAKSHQSSLADLDLDKDELEALMDAAGEAEFQKLQQLERWGIGY